MPRILSFIFVSLLCSTALVATLAHAGGGATPATQTSYPACGTGPLPQIKELDWMIGRWDVAVTWFDPGSGKSWKLATQSAIEPMLNGTFVRETIAVPFGKITTNMVGVRSYDRFKQTYRLVWFDDVTTLADVYEGEMKDGTIALTNLRCDTSQPVDATTMQHMRITQIPNQNPATSKDQFALRWEITRDKGKTWLKTCEFAYQRKR